jgi:hypothetical protein
VSANPNPAASRRLRALARAPLVLFFLLALASTATAAEPGWRLEQPPPPPGATFKVPLGPPGDLQFYGPSRGLLAVEGSSTIPRGLFTYDGRDWHQLATVCGGPGDTARIAFAGPREFWTVSEPSKPRSGSGMALCHFKDGQVVGSYSQPLQAADPFRQMRAATCNGPDDCWFGGFGSDAGPDIDWVGAFHLHWNGATLETVYSPQGRGVTDLESHAGKIFESTLVGAAIGRRLAPDLAEPEPDPLDPTGASTRPRLLHRIEGGTFRNEDFVTAPAPCDPSTQVPSQGSELLALDSDGQQLWAVGGGAASGPQVPGTVNSLPGPPIAARLAGGLWRDLPIDPCLFGTDERFVDVAAVPFTDSAWVAVTSVDRAQSDTERAKVAHIAADGTTTIESLPSNSWGRGSAAKIAFNGPNDGWLVTHSGWIFHYTDGVLPPADADPAYAGTITFRPNEAAEQFVPDRPPVDDSELFRPPPVEIQQPPAEKVTRLAPLLKKIRTARRGSTLVVRFVLVRPARVALIARRKGKVVARTRTRMMKPGRHVLRLKLSRKRWPQRLSFSAREPGATGGGGGGDGDTVSTGGGDGDTVATRYRPVGGGGR